MGFPTKVQRINRKNGEQWYIGFPVAVAQAMDFERSEVVEWTIVDRDQLILRRVSNSSESKKKQSKD